jgi:protein-S-isoprenylcysteine O-methyltransferase Ste14
MARRGFMDLLVIPWVDKTIAILACVPNVIELYRRWVIGHVSFPRAVLGLQLLVLIIVMVLRRAPVRVTPNPWFWLLALVTSYGPLFFSAYAQQGLPLVSSSISNALAVVSVIVVVYSLLSLGRNIGFVPAQRQIVTRGAYAFVRHPNRLLRRVAGLRS